MFSHYHVLPRLKGEGWGVSFSRYMHAIYIEPPLILISYLAAKTMLLLDLNLDKRKAARWARAECAQDVMSVTTLSKILQLFLFMPFHKIHNSIFLMIRAFLSSIGRLIRLLSG